MELKYGEQVLEVPLEPSRVKKVLLPSGGGACVNDLPAAFQKALAEPVAGKPFRERIAERQPERIAVIVEDKTRKNPEYPILLDMLLSEIRAVCQSEVLLVVAYGTHPEHTPKEQEQLYGRENLSRVTLVNHHAKDPTVLVRVGLLVSGNELWLNRAVASADLVLSFGDITPHAFAGFSGGRKAILPGVAGYETIERNHTMVCHPGVGLGKLEGNPIHREMMEAADLAGLDFIINFVRNVRGEIVSIVTGNHREAFAEGVRVCRETNAVRIPEVADVVWVSCGGYPKDKSLYHAQRAIIAAVSAVKQGGTIVAFGKFPEGVGDALYSDWLPKPLHDILNLPQNAIRLGVHSAYLMARNLSHAEILLYTEMEEELATKLHFRKVEALSAIHPYLVEKHGLGYTGYVIPNGSQIMPEIETK